MCRHRIRLGDSVPAQPQRRPTTERLWSRGDAACGSGEAAKGESRNVRPTRVRTTASVRSKELGEGARKTQRAAHTASLTQGLSR